LKQCFFSGKQINIMRKGGMEKKSFVIIGLTICILVLSSAVAVSQNSNGSKDLAQVVEQIGVQGKVNWSGGYLEATGIGTPPEKPYGTAQERALALRKAQADAHRNLLEVVKGIHVDSDTEIRDLIVTSDAIRTKVDGLVQGAQIVNRNYLFDGTVEVKMRMPIYGDNSLASVIMPAILPASQASPVSPQVTPAPPSSSASAPEVFTGLIVDARGVKIRPTMKPKILDENGKEVYVYMMTDQTHANQQGISSYSKDLTAARNNPRVTNNPLTVKALRLEGPTKGDIVISSADAVKISGVAENLNFLKKCRVVIVLD
jgi:hypothetical protein